MKSRAPDRSCDLECQGKDDLEVYDRHEFVGPVKIVLVETTPTDYKKKVFFSGLFSFMMLLHGASMFTVFFFTLSFRLPLLVNLHVFLCTMGFHTFLTGGIIMLNNFFGGSAYQMPSGRKFHHFLLEVFATAFGVVGAVCTFKIQTLKLTAMTLHGASGLAATIFTITSCIIGPTAHCTAPSKMYAQFNKKSHLIVSGIAFGSSTVSFIMGLRKQSFIDWLPTPNVHYILGVFTLVYTALLLISSFFKSKFGQ